jgi:hypothetical protein
MHPDLLCRALAAIESEITLDEFQTTSGIASRSVAKGVLGFLAANNIGNISKGTIKFASSDKLRVAALALQEGCDIEQASKHLSWKDFEGLASDVLTSLGYKTRTNVRFTKPRMEIDVVGVEVRFALAVDCKHWKKNSLSSIVNYSQKQVARAERLIKQERGITRVVPVILTLHAESVKFVGGIPVVPISQFKSFVMDVKGFLPKIYVVG